MRAVRPEHVLAASSRDHPSTWRILPQQLRIFVTHRVPAAAFSQHPCAMSAASSSVRPASSSSRRRSVHRVRRRPRARSSLSSSAAQRCLQSPDIVYACASYLSVSELLQASALSRCLHALFDSEAVWRARLRQAEAEQYARFDEPELDCAVLTSAQLAALPPLPPLSAAAALCLQAFVQSEEQRRQGEPSWQGSDYSPQASCLTAVLHLAFTLAYHARIITPRWRGELPHRASYVQFELQWSQNDGDAGRWAVSRVGGPDSGWRAHNLADNVRDEDQKLNAQFNAASGVSSRARYIALCRCSEHTRTGCHRLLPPAGPLAERHRRGDCTLPPACPLPLCSSCLPIFARCLATGGVNTNTAEYSVLGVIRISRTEFEVATYRENHGYRFRVSIQEGEVVAHYGSSSATYETRDNVCERCLCAIRESGTIHSHRCTRCEKGIWE